MEAVWVELYKKKRHNSQATEEFLYPAHETNASWAAIRWEQAFKLRKSEPRFLEKLILEEGVEDPHTNTRRSIP
jgi:hypothetical protein